VERLAFQTGVWPAAFRICAIALTERPKAKRDAEHLARVCRQLQADSALPVLWQTAAELLEHGFHDVSDAMDLLRRGKDLAEAGEENLSVLAYLLASLDPDITLVHALAAHCFIASLVEQTMGGMTAVQNEIVVPFSWDYWQGKFDRMRFSFRSPSLVESRMAEARQQAGKHDVKNLMRIMAEGIGSDLPARLRAWLNG
jgi:hypothetical protein